jgi:hypothetical protein
MKLRLPISAVQNGDIVRFASYSLRVQAEPIRSPSGAVRLHGRRSDGGCPLVSQWYMDGSRIVAVERPGKAVSA